MLGLRRRGEINERPSVTPLLAGDMLLVEGRRDALETLAETKGFLVVGTPSHPEQRPAKLMRSFADWLHMPQVVWNIALLRFGLSYDQSLSVVKE